MDVVRVRQPAGSFPDPPLPALSVLMVTRGVIRTRIGLGDKPFTRVRRPGTVVVAPPDTACDYEVGDPHELPAVAVPTVAVTPLTDAAGVRRADLGSLHADALHDPLGGHPGRRLFAEAAAAGPGGGPLRRGRLPGPPAQRPGGPRRVGGS